MNDPKSESVESVLVWDLWSGRTACASTAVGTGEGLGVGGENKVAKRSSLSSLPGWDESIGRGIRGLIRDGAIFAVWQSE